MKVSDIDLFEVNEAFAAVVLRYIDALKIVAEGVNKLRENKLSGIVITHYQRLLDYLKPDTIHILADGKIIKTGDKSLALLLEEKGYQGITGVN